MSFGNPQIISSSASSVHATPSGPTPAQVPSATGGGGPAAVIVSPSGGDDSVQLTAAIAAVVAAGQANNTNYGEVWFDTTKGPYSLSGPTSHAQSGNSQVPLPVIPSGTSTPKFTLRLRGIPGGGAVALPHWNQTVGQKTGAILRTTLVGTNDVSFGEASVIGGPTNIQGFGGGSGNAWSNMLILVDGVSIVSATTNPTMCGFNFEGLLEAKVLSGGYFADASPTAMNALITTPANFTNQWVYGLKMPMTDNNDLCIIDDWSAEGVWYSYIMAEHTHVRDSRSVYCGWGIMLDNRVSTPHWAQVDYASTELCVNIMGVLGASGEFKVNIGLIDNEGGGPIWDSNSLIIGDIRVGANQAPAKFDWTQGGLGSWIGNWASIPTNGQFMTITSPDTIPGVTANQPAVPASGADFWNKSLRTAVFSISGGTVSAIAVDGAATGLLSGNTFIVPPGKKITLTYTVAPLWHVLLIP